MKPVAIDAANEWVEYEKQKHTSYKRADWKKKVHFEAMESIPVLASDRSVQVFIIGFLGGAEPTRVRRVFIGFGTGLGSERR